jgi:hypothetical protein
MSSQLHTLSGRLLVSSRHVAVMVIPIAPLQSIGQSDLLLLSKLTLFGCLAICYDVEMDGKPCITPCSLSTGIYVEEMCM